MHYLNAEQTNILDDTGRSVPVDPLNCDYMAILASGEQIGPYVAPINPVTFTPRAFIETLFTPAEQQAIFTAAQTAAGWQFAKFIALVSASPAISLSDPELIADIGVVQASGILTAQRAAQILAGTPV